MIRIAIVCSLLLAAGLIGAPSLSADQGEAPLKPVVQAPEELPWSLEESHEHLFTPAEQQPSPDLTDQGDSWKVDQFRTCTAQEELQCDPGCICVFVSNALRCICF